MIFKASIEDVRSIIEVCKEFDHCTKYVRVDVDITVATYEGFIRNGIGALFGVIDGDKIVGGLGCVKSPDLHSPKIFAVECFWFVLPEFSGHGKDLLKTFEEWAKEQGCTHMAMIHLADSFPESLEKFYIRRGYELVEKHYVKEV